MPFRFRCPSHKYFGYLSSVIISILISLVGLFDRTDFKRKFRISSELTSKCFEINKKTY